MKSNRRQYRYLKILLTDYCEYYYRRLDVIGYPTATIEYNMMRTGVRASKKSDMRKGVYVGSLWQAQKETGAMSEDKTPEFLIDWGSPRLRRVAVAVYELPFKHQRIIRTLFHPDRSKGMKNTDFCGVLRVSPAVLNRRIRDIYHELSRKLNLGLTSDR